jgi:hypothetical protein
MLESPDVAIVQYTSGVMQVAHNNFENAVTYFTNLIYHSIQYSVGCGDLASFVGHNAFLRWKAIQSVAFTEEGDTKFWSDSHVSEDFDQALRLQIAGFIIRLASYYNRDNGFKEGVSLTVFDELARWEKYTYGCNELLFHPLYKWPYKGPFTSLLWKLLRSNVKTTSKVTILGYVFTYYAMAAALPFCVVNYVLMGLIPDSLDHYYLDSWRIMIILLVVFNLLVRPAEVANQIPNACVAVAVAVTVAVADEETVPPSIQLPALPSPPPKLLRQPLHHHQVDALLHGLLRRRVHPPVESHPVPLLLHQHRMGVDGEGARGDGLLHRHG